MGAVCLHMYICVGVYVEGVGCCLCVRKLLVNQVQAIIRIFVFHRNTQSHCMFIILPYVHNNVLLFSFSDTYCST